MNVLVAFECYGRVREAFRNRGHNTFSVDLKESIDDSPFHFTCDALDVMMYYDSKSSRAIKASKDLADMGMSEIDMWGKEAVKKMEDSIKKGTREMCPKQRKRKQQL